MLRVLDLFSGIGGFSLGLERAGMQTVRFVEADKKCRNLLSLRWPNVPISKDVKTYEPRRGEADVVCGGFPCQAFSTASRGRRVAEDLWPYMRRIIAGVRPVWVVAENVDSIDDERPASELEDLGFTVWSLEVDAAPRGRRHERRRAIFVAYANSSGEPKCPVHEKMALLPRCPGRGWWDKSAPLGVANGVPGWLDRCRQLGNSFSPIVAEGIGRAIVAATPIREAQVMPDWQPIETAPKDGTEILATHNRTRDGSFWPPYRTHWGIGSPHTVEDDDGKPVLGFIVNGGKPWWLSEGGEKLAPTPTHWKPIEEQ